MNKLGTVIAFLAGTAIGGMAAWRVANERYAKISEEDILSVKEAFRNREQKLKDEIEELKSKLEVTECLEEEEKVPSTILSTNEHQDKGDINEYVRMVNRTKYAHTSVPQKEDHSVEAPYVISPEEFGEMDGYTQISLTYFEDDDILSDENGVIIDDPEEIVGDALNHFGDYEEDSVFVRSDPKRCDYEILKDLRSYAEFRSTLPPKI
jgi:hypothetical protein